MKIMYVDYSVEGHHVEYLKHLAENEAYESVVVLPQQVHKLKARQVVYSKLDLKEKKLSAYLRHMKELKEIAKREKADVIHFLDGDSVMRYFDLGYRILREYPMVVTFHHLFPGKLREYSMKSVLNRVSKVIVHTDEIEMKLRSYGYSNVSCVHYPCFLPLEHGNRESKGPKTLLALGGTRYDKGLDILLEALQEVKTEFRLIIAGKEEDFTREMIESAASSYRDKIELKLHFLSKEEVISCIQEADEIVLPYRKIFDGASGPMCEGAFQGKEIIGADHGSLGSMIRKNHLGRTFISENIEDLTKTLETSLNEDFTYDETAKAYQRSLDPQIFIRKCTSIYEGLL